MRYNILDSGGNVINTIEADEEFCKNNFQFYEMVPEADQAPAKRILTKLKYMQRFTENELIAIYTTAKSNIQVEIWLEKFKLAEDIDLDDAETLSGLQSMEAAGLIGIGRANQILG